MIEKFAIEIQMCLGLINEVMVEFGISSRKILVSFSSEVNCTLAGISSEKISIKSVFIAFDFFMYNTWESKNYIYEENYWKSYFADLWLVIMDSTLPTNSLYIL